MALKGNVHLKNNFGTETLIPDATIRVGSIRGSKDRVMATVLYFMTDETDTSFHQHEYVFNPDLDGPNFIAQAYSYIKTLPQFAETQDA